MKKKLLISAISLAMACIPTFQASASWNPFGKTTKAEAITKDFKDAKESATAAAKDGVDGIISTSNRVTTQANKAIESFFSGVNEFMSIPVIQQHETMITCGAAGGTAGFMGRYLRAKTRFSKEVNLKGMQKLLYRTKGGGIGGKAALLAGLFLLEPQVQKQTALQRTSDDKFDCGYAAAGLGFIAGVIL